jgi:hypothetical protein
LRETSIDASEADVKRVTSRCRIHVWVLKTERKSLNGRRYDRFRAREYGTGEWKVSMYGNSVEKTTRYGFNIVKEVDFCQSSIFGIIS